MKGLKTYFTYLHRNKLFTLVNVAGLGISLMFVLLIANMVVRQLTVGSDIKDIEHVYVLSNEEYSASNYLVGERLSNRYPEMADWCAVNAEACNSGSYAVIDNRKTSLEIYCVKDNFFRFFGYSLTGSCNIPLYVFNYTDYKLWKKYAEELRGNKEKKGSRNRIEFFRALGCSDFELEPFKNFYFSRTRKSLEHYYPQAKAGDNMLINLQDINCFGNFAMIGSDANSSGSNWNPIDKKNRYLDTKSNQVSVASLKFRIMLQICQDNYDAGIKDDTLKRPFGLEWNVDDMVRHQAKMLEIIMNL